MSLRLYRPGPLIGLALLLCTAGTQAQEPALPALTFGDALHRAAAQNPALIAKGYKERAAEAMIEQAGVRPNPTLDVAAENFFGTGVVRGVRRIETTVQASQTFERGAKREKRLALANSERDAAGLEFMMHRAEVLVTAASAYVDAMVAQQRAALAEEPLNLARDTLAAVDARVKAGAASPAESARARAGLASAQAEQGRAQANLFQTRAALAATWGGEATDIIAVSGVLNLPDTLPSEESFLSRVTRHPRLDLLQAIIASRRAALALEQAHAAQDVTASGGLRFLSESSDAALVAGISIPLPVRNRNQGNIRAARSTLAGAEQTLHATEVELRAALLAAWRDLQAAHAAARNLRHEALPANEEAHTIVRQAYEQGQLPLIDVLDAQRALATIRQEILEAEAAYATALIRAESLADPGFTHNSSLFSSP